MRSGLTLTIDLAAPLRAVQRAWRRALSLHRQDGRCAECGAPLTSDEQAYLGHWCNDCEYDAWDEIERAEKDAHRACYPQGEFAAVQAPVRDTFKWPFRVREGVRDGQLGAPSDAMKVSAPFDLPQEMPASAYVAAGMPIPSTHSWWGADLARPADFGRFDCQGRWRAPKARSGGDVDHGPVDAVPGRFQRS